MARVVAQLTLRLVSVALIGVVVVGGPAAMAQEYGESVGDLQGVPATITQGELVPLQGDGFAAGAVLEVALVSSSGDTHSLGSVAAGADGSVDASVLLPSNLLSGPYTISVKGEASDGGTRLLTAGLQVGVAPETTASTSTSTSQAPPATEPGTDTPTGGTSLPLIIGGGILVVGVAGLSLWLRFHAPRR